jgi:hypothetical protein
MERLTCLSVEAALRIVGRDLQVKEQLARGSDAIPWIALSPCYFADLLCAIPARHCGKDRYGVQDGKNQKKHSLMVCQDTTNPPLVNSSVESLVYG